MGGNVLMERIAIIADVHSNIVALKAVMNDIESRFKNIQDKNMPKDLKSKLNSLIEKKKNFGKEQLINENKKNNNMNDTFENNRKKNRDKYKHNKIKKLSNNENKEEDKKDDAKINIITNINNINEINNNNSVGIMNQNKIITDNNNINNLNEINNNNLDVNIILKKIII